MKNRIFRHLLPLLFLLPSALAQAVNLPLSSVGDGVGWDKRIGLDDYRLAIFEKAANTPLSVELYSPEINLNDYANKRNVQNYYGDEIYGKNLQISTRFSLEQKAGASGKVAEKTYGTSQSHSYDTLYTGSLAQGFYPLPIRTSGNGKNAFSFRLSPGIAVEASQFTVVTRGQFNQDQLAARLTVGKSAIGKVLKLQNFDADGPKEMELFVRFPNGQRRKLTSSPDTQWATDAYRVDPEMVGEWAIIVRILPTTTQFSNSVALRLLLDNKPYYARMAFTPGEAPKVTPPEPKVTPPPPAPVVDITLTKTASAVKITVGDKLTYTLTVVNTGPDAATGVTLTDALPAGLGSINAPEAQVSGNNLTWNIGNMTNGERRVYKVEAVAAAAGKLENNASVKANEKESTLENNRASVSVEAVSPPPPPPPPSADLSIQKTVKTAKVTLGDSVGYTLEVLNNGPDTATNVVVEDSLPEGLSLESATPAATVSGNKLTWKLGNLTKGERQIINLQAKTASAGKITNEASVSASEKDPNLSNNKGNVALEVVAPPPPPPPVPVVDLAVSKTASQSKLTVGDKVSYILTVSNNGPDAATEIELTDTLPAGLTLVSAPNAVVSGNTLTWKIIRLSNGAQRTFRVDATANAAGKLENTASVKGKEQDSKLENNRASATIEAVSPPPPPPPPPLADVSVQKTVNQAKVTVGDSLTYTLNIVNNGPDAATNVVVEDTLPEGLSLEASAPAANKNGNQLSWNLGTLTKGERQTITLQVKTAKAGNITNEASVKAAEQDPDPNNNKGNVSLEVVSPPPSPPAPVKVPQVDLALSKTVEPGKVKVGENVRYTLTVVNRGPDTATEVVLEDVLPEGLTLAVANPAAKVSGNRLTWNLDSLKNGEQQRFVVEASTTQAGTLSNNASVSSKEADTDPSNNRAKVGLEVEEVPPPPPPVIVPEPEPKPAELPPLERESQVLVLAKLAQIPTSGFVILSDKLPTNARYITGSSRRVNNPQADLSQLQSTTWLPGPQQQGDALPDPIASGDRLYWVLPYSNTDTYALNYRLAHSGALQMPTDRIGVILGIPQSRSADAPRTNLGDASPVAQALGLGELRLIQGDSEVLQGLQQATVSAQNNLTSSNTVRLEIKPVRLTTDATSQPALLITASDVGNYPINTLVTLEVSSEPTPPDAAPTIPGYQVQLINGQAVVALSDLAGSAFDRVAPSTVQAEARLGAVSTSAQFKVSDFSVAYLEPSGFSIGAATRPWLANGAVGIEASFGSGLALKASGSAFARGPVGNFTLTLATDARYRYDSSYQGFEATDLLPPANPYERFPLLGDSSRLGSDARSSDALFLKLEQGDSYLLYGQLNPGFSGLITAYTPEVNGVQATVRDNGFSLTGFATPAPNANRLEVFGGDATGFYWLQGSNSTALAPSPSNQIPALGVGVKPGTEQLHVVRYDRDNPNLKIDVQLLGRGADYDLDYASGRVRLYRPITGFDPDGNPQYLEVAYALATATDTGWQNAQVRYGAQAKYDGGAFGISATYLKFDAVQPALLGIGANLHAGNLQLGAEVGLSGGDGTAAGAVQASYTGDNLQFRLRYQDKGPFFVEPYVGNTSASKDLNAAATLKLGAFSLNANFSSSQPYSTLALTQAASIEVSTQLGSAKFGLGYALERATTDKNWLTAGLELPLGSLAVLLNQKIGLGNTNGETGIGLDYALSPNFGIRYNQSIVYLNGLSKLGGQGTLGLRGSFTNRELIQTLNGNDPATADDFGTTNLAVNYDLPGIDGQAARTRVGLETQIPLSNNLSLAIGGETIFADAGQGSAGGSLGLNFGSDNARGSLGAQASVTATGVKQVYTGSAILQTSDSFTVAPAAEYSILPGGKSGGRFSLAAALRADDWSLLTQNRYLSGIYGNGLEGELRTAYEANERWFWRGGVAYKLASDIFTGQISTGLTWYLTDAFGLEGGVSYAFTPVASTPSSSLLFGIGANLRFAPGWSVGAGFNFEALSIGGLTQYLDQRPGFYLRLDWKFDERTFGLK